jgi:hypothetical protein
MLIPINFEPSSSKPKLPPSLAKISHDEVVLIELQGALEVESTQEGEKDGKMVGNLEVDNAQVRLIVVLRMWRRNLETINKGQGKADYRASSPGREDCESPKAAGCSSAFDQTSTTSTVIP